MMRSNLFNNLLLRSCRIASQNLAGGGQLARRHPSLIPLPLTATLRSFTSSGNSSDRQITHWGVKIVPERKAYVIERFGKYLKTLTSGTHLLIPIVDKIAYDYSLKDEPIPMPRHSAVTKDNINVFVDGTVFVKIDDPKSVSYRETNPINDVEQLALTAMRSEVGKMTLQETTEEGDALNERIGIAISEAVKDWGLKCLGYKITGISPSPEVREAMEKKVQEEYEGRVKNLEWEGETQAKINIAHSKRISALIVAQAEAMGNLKRKLAVAKATSLVSGSLAENLGAEARLVGLRKSGECIDVFGNVTEQGANSILPRRVSVSAEMIKQVIGDNGANINRKKDVENKVINQ